MKCLISIVFLTNLLFIVNAASILDYIVSTDLESRNENDNSQNCHCTGPSCICCIDFNISFIDLGGPGCVRINYVGQDEGVVLNVSYGDSFLHSETVKGPEPKPACLSVFTTLAQVCAKFINLNHIDNGLKGCLNLEPKLLGQTQIELPVGCFEMHPNEMRVIEPPPIKEVEDDEEEEEEEVTEVNNQESLPSGETNSTKPDDSNTIAGISTSDILAAVSASADEGLAMLSNWLGLNVNRFNKPENETQKEENLSAEEA